MSADTSSLVSDIIFTDRSRSVGSCPSLLNFNYLSFLRGVPLGYYYPLCPGGLTRFYMSFVSAVGRLPPQPRLTMLVDAYILTVRRHASVFYLFAPDFTVLAVRTLIARWTAMV